MNIMKSQRMGMALSAAATLIAAAVGCAGCDGGEPGDATEPPAVAVVESKVVQVDDTTAANASKLADGRVRVEIRGSDARLRFVSEYRKKDATPTNNKVVLSYELHIADAVENMSPQRIEKAAMELEMAELPSLDEAVTGTVYIQGQFTSAVLGLYDNWGCDLLPGRFNWIGSCGLKGGCCDIHDACYARHGCTSASWKSAPWSKCQLLCNAPAVACFTGPFNPGPSTCCFRGNCGRAR